MTDELAQRTTESSGPAADGVETVAPGTVPARPVEIELTDPSLYFNRELSWLDFNDRVLQLAEDPQVPLMERVNFCAIYQDNLDEFFMVRVAGLHDHVESKTDARGADGMAAAQVIDLLRDRVIALRGRLTRCFEDEIQPALTEHGIRIISLDDANATERQEVEHLFTSQVFPALTPLVIGRGRPFPYISNLSLSIGVLLRNPEKDEEVGARVKVPTELLRRFLSIGDGLTFVPLEEVIAANLDDLFPGMEIVHHSLFRVTRDTDYDV
ncbi:MAG TPA: RNA degradosome polyphosphate kinase, partial [Solirubrobacterales bacterium]|nr:RNA degradosome polyphosphate kinase [Solirubrobacterales bacterium]